MKPTLLFLLLCALVAQINSYKILVITSNPAHSHFTLAFSLAKELANRNHQVSFINPFPQKTPINNLRDIPITGSFGFVNEYKKSYFRLGALGVLGNHILDTTLGAAVTEYALNDTNVQSLLNSKETFDLVIIEHFANEALVGIGHHFKTPIIFLASVPSCFKNNYLFGNPSPTSYIPDIFRAFSKKMSFFQRLDNFLVSSFNDVGREMMMLSEQRKLFKKYTKTDLELDDVLREISLILITSHPSVTDAVPHLPNIIEIGGYHVEKPKKLPKDLQVFLDEAKEGVILFSMGSNLKSRDLSPSVRASILKAFSKIQAKVLWKFEEELQEAPKNVKIINWLPQQDIIGHPNIKGFITHCGLLSVIEAIHYGVPIIGIPVFGDQHNNIATAEANGYGIKVDLKDLTEEKFLQALNEILNNQKYRENAKARSKFMHDQPLKQMDLAVYWIEHVIRNKGAPFLRSGGIELMWYQRENVDVICFIVLTILFFIVIVYKLLLLCVRRNKSISKHKKNK